MNNETNKITHFSDMTVKEQGIFLKGMSLGEDIGYIVAMQQIKERIHTMKIELNNKGIETKYFSPLEGYIEDCIAWKEDKIDQTDNCD